MTTTTTGGRGPYAKTARVRGRILDACAEAFAESGYRATTVKEIARRAGISEGGLVHHFAGKAELLGAVLERREREAARRVSGTGGLPALLTILDLALADAHNPGLVELHSVLSTEAISPEHPGHEHYRERYHSLRRFATLAFEALHREGRLRAHLGPAELAAAYIALCDGLQVQWLYDRDAVDTAAILRRFLESVVPDLTEAATS